MFLTLAVCCFIDRCAVDHIEGKEQDEESSKNDELLAASFRQNSTSTAAADSPIARMTMRRRRFTKECLMFDELSGNFFNVPLGSPTTDDGQRFSNADNASRPFTKILHRMWKTDQVPVNWEMGVVSCRFKNREYVYCHWTDSELESFIAAEYPDFLATYLAYPYSIQRADAARYHILYHYGGTYLDLDIVCRVPISRIIDALPSSVGLVVAEAEPIGVVGDFIVVRQPRDPVMRSVLAGLRCAASRWYPLPYVTVMFSTGPVYLTRRLSGRVTTSVSNDPVRPIAATSPLEQSVAGHVFVIRSADYNGRYFGNLVGASWHQWDGRLIWYIYQLRRQWLVVCFMLVTALALLFYARSVRRRSFRRYCTGLLCI
jgi:mannosyltransferase OCH1-like enzyme